MQKTGVLLLNLGTPDHCDTQSVRRYLKEFLSDPRVIDIPPIARWLLLHAIILPFRSKKSAAAYQQIWSPTEGSPLLEHSKALQTALSARLGDRYQVILGMRYGNPSIVQGLEKLQSCTRLIILPLFPQYASASTGSALEKTYALLSSQWNVPEVITQRDFYAEPGFIAAYAALIQRTIPAKIELLVLSYHGLPERHIRKSGCATVCTEACPAVGPAGENAYCYRAQCYATSRAIAKALDFPADKYVVCFQSRLGRTPWIKPYTDALFPALIQKNIRHIAVACPSFVADCLETLEEINLRGRAQWESLGGKTFVSIPCLNADPLWVEALADKIMQYNLTT